MPPLQMPKGKFLSTVKVGEKGQIVIPKEARNLFGIQPGDVLLLLADESQGIAIVQNNQFLDFANLVLHAQEWPREGGGAPAEGPDQPEPGRKKRRKGDLS